MATLDHQLSTNSPEKLSYQKTVSQFAAYGLLEITKKKSGWVQCNFVSEFSGLMSVLGILLGVVGFMYY